MIPTQEQDHVRGVPAVFATAQIPVLAATAIPSCSIYSLAHSSTGGHDELPVTAITWSPDFSTPVYDKRAVSRFRSLQSRFEPPALLIQKLAAGRVCKTTIRGLRTPETLANACGVRDQCSQDPIAVAVREERSAYEQQNGNRSRTK
jgi:hypothetical protein